MDIIKRIENKNLKTKSFRRDTFLYPCSSVNIWAIPEILPKMGPIKKAVMIDSQTSN